MSKQNVSGIIAALCSQERFDEIPPLFAESNLTSNDLIQLYKKQNKKSPFLFSNPTFWKSNLPLFHLQEVLESELRSTFLEKYFSTDAHINDALNECLFHTSKDTFVQHTKLNRVFLMPGFRQSIRQLADKNPDLKPLVKEFEFCVEEWQTIDYEEQKDNLFLRRLNLGEIMMGFVLYYQSVKRSPESLGNKSRQFEIENALNDELHRILALFQQNSSLSFNYSSNAEMQQVFERYETPHPILVKEGLVVPLDRIFQLIFDIAKRSIHRTSRRNRIELYQCGYADFETTVLNPAPLKTNHRFQIFRKNDYKKGAEEFYFSDFKIKKTNHSLSPKINISAGINAMSFYGIPDEITYNDKAIDLEKVLLLLQHFSAFKGPPERIIVLGKMSVISNLADKRFRKLFGSNESISLFDFGELKWNISVYFQWTEEETESILGFLTFDLTEEDIPKIWIQRPFLKINDQVIWLGAFLKDRRWSNVLLNKLKSEPIPKYIGETIAKNLEKHLEKLLQKAGFTTIQGFEYGHKKGTNIGDLDVVAFKDNHLFICEVKSGERSHDFSYAVHQETVKLEDKAAGQLQRALRHLLHYWTKLQTEMGIETQLEDITVIPMIVTDIFEGDLRIYGTGIRKTSLLELDVLLNNKKRDLLEMYLINLSMGNSNIPVNNFRDTDWDLWEGESTLSVEMLLKKLDEDAVWGESLI
jgi:hypothetical protein